MMTAVKITVMVEMAATVVMAETVAMVAMVIAAETVAMAARRHTTLPTHLV